MANIDPNRTVNVAVQVLPFVRDADRDVYRIVDHAISKIDSSGVAYEVGPLETVLEGTLDKVLEVAKAAHLACFEAGAEEVITMIKIADRRTGVSMREKTEKYRQ